MLMFDSDITFPVDLVFRMLERDVDFIGAAAPMRKIRWEQFATAARNSCPNPATQALEFEAFFTPAQKQSGNLETERGTCEVESVGGGFLLLHRSVIERVAEAHPDLRFRGQHDEECFDIFASLIVDGRRLDEDVSFVHRWKALGGAVHLMLDAPLGHHGSFTFRGNFVETLMASAFLRPGP